MPLVLNIRDLGGRVPPGAVFIGRPSPWGNPFPLRQESSRDRVLQRYADWLLLQPDLIAAAQRELRGKNLACFCAPKTCHGDVLLAVANAPSVWEARLQILLSNMRKSD